MSTKITLAYSDDFHFYKECFDDFNVYYEKCYPCGKNTITKIPLYVWDIIKEYTKDNYFHYAHLTDEEIENMVSQNVEEYFDSYFKSDKKSQIFIELNSYCAMNKPKELHIQTGISQIIKQKKKELDMIEKSKNIKNYINKST